MAEYRPKTPGETVKIEAECDSCSGTGLYSGMCEAKGEAVVCIRCGGTGKQIVSVKTFSARHEKRGIKTVRRSRGGFIATGVGGTGRTITYAQFRKGEMP